MSKIFILLDRTGGSSLAIDWQGNRFDARRQAITMLKTWRERGQTGTVQVILNGQSRPYFKGYV